MIVNSSAASISSGTGALIVNGGLGIAGSINAGGSLNLSGAATIGQSLTLSSMTSGSLLFAGSSGLVSEDNSKLFWDGGNQRLGLGTNVPAQTLSVSGASYFSGNVGIGTTAPSVNLDIQAQTGVEPALRLANDGTTANPAKITLFRNTIDFAEITQVLGGGTGGGLVINSHRGAGDANILFRTSNSEKMRIMQTGNVGIGTPSPTAKLHVTSGGNNSTSYTARFQSSSSVAGSGGILFDQNSTYGYKLYTQGTSVNAGSLIFDYIDVASGNTVYNSVLSLNNGNVGIGTSSPIARLDLISNSAELPSTIYNSSAGALYKISGRELAVGTVNAPPYATYFQSRRTDDNPNDLVFNPAGGNVGIGTTTPQNKLMVVGVAGLPSNSENPEASLLVRDGGNNWLGIGNSNSGNWIQSSQPGIAGPAFNLLLNPAGGNVGIGTSAPTSILHLSSGDTTGTQFKISNTDGNGATVGFISTGSANDGGVGNLRLDAPFGTPRMIVTSGGAVGIGTAAPTAKLDIYGTTKFSADAFGYLSITPTGGDGGSSVIRQTTNAPRNGGDLTLQVDASLQGGNLIIATGGSTERMRVSSNGNIGIGTTSPQSKFVVSQNGGDIGVAFGEGLGVFSNISTNADASLLIGHNLNFKNSVTDRNTLVRSVTHPALSGAGLVFGGNTSNVNGVLVNDIAFFTEASGNAVSASPFLASPKFILKSSGNVGIGTNSPNSKLQVSGGASGNADYGVFTIQDGSANGLSMGYDATNNWSWLYSRSVGNTARRLAFFSNNANQNLPQLILAGDNVGIGNASPTYKLDVTGDINSTTRLRIAGTEVCTSAGCTSSSDERLKQNIQPLDDALENILSLQGVEYDYINKEKFGSAHQIGVIAQDVEKVYPEVVKTDSETGLKSVAYDHLVAPLIEAVKTLYKRITGVENQQVIQARQIASKADQEALNAANAQIKKLEAENAAKTNELEAMKAYLCSKDPAAPICK